MEIIVQTVSDLVRDIKKSLESQFIDVTVEGEVSNLSTSSAGHWYFTISDKDSSLSVALFKMDATRNPLIRKLKNGDKVVCGGNIGVYGKRGTFQLIVKTIQPAGKGDLKAQYELLKLKLTQEGMFDPEIKKAIPQFPKRVGVITARGGAALQDFLNVYKRRSFSMDILLLPALVQGDSAPKSIRDALKRGLDLNNLDLIVITRGGGSLEDLWAFNDEGLVRDIFHANIPIVSAIGHQTDFTLCDFVSDLRCETPTAAAELLTAPQMELTRRLNGIRDRLNHKMELVISRFERTLRRCHPNRILETIWSKLYKSQNRLNDLDLVNRFYQLTGIAELHQRLDQASVSLKRVVENNLQRATNKLYNLNDKLLVLDPRSVLGRGYTFLQSDDGSVVKDLLSFEKIGPDTLLKINFKDGSGEVKKI